MAPENTYGNYWSLSISQLTDNGERVCKVLVTSILAWEKILQHFYLSLKDFAFLVI
jgi:hypothetical protein